MGSYFSYKFVAISDLLCHYCYRFLSSVCSMLNIENVVEFLIKLAILSVHSLRDPNRNLPNTPICSSYQITVVMCRDDLLASRLRPL